MLWHSLSTFDRSVRGLRKVDPRGRFIDSFICFRQLNHGTFVFSGLRYSLISRIRWSQSRVPRREHVPLARWNWYWRRWIVRRQFEPKLTAFQKREGEPGSGFCASYFDNFFRFRLLFWYLFLEQFFELMSKANCRNFACHFIVWNAVLN